MKTIGIREFLRGGYRDLDELTLITHHGRPMATWMPQPHARKRSMDGMKTLNHAVDSKSSPRPEHGE